MASRNSPPPTSSPAEAPTDRRQDILNAALACAAEGGVDAVTIDGVRARCGASVGSIYHHFGMPSPLLLMDEPFGALDAQTKL
eukprot:gene2207-2161_t